MVGRVRDECALTSVPPPATSTRTQEHRHMSCCSSVTVVVDHSCGRVYDSRYLVTTHAPRGCASHLRSSASTWIRANVAAACEPRLHAVVGHFTIHERWRHPLVEDDRSGSASASPRGACCSRHDQRSRPAERVDVKGLRRRATLHWRYGGVAHPVSFPWQGTPGVGAGRSRDPRARRERRESVPHVRCVHPHRHEGLNRPRSSPGGRPHRPPPGARLSSPTACSTFRAAASDTEVRLPVGCMDVF